MFRNATYARFRQRIECASAVRFAQVLQPPGMLSKRHIPLAGGCVCCNNLVQHTGWRRFPKHHCPHQTAKPPACGECLPTVAADRCCGLCRLDMGKPCLPRTRDMVESAPELDLTNPSLGQRRESSRNVSELGGGAFRPGFQRVERGVLCRRLRPGRIAMPDTVVRVDARIALQAQLRKIAPTTAVASSTKQWPQRGTDAQLMARVRRHLAYDDRMALGKKRRQRFAALPLPMPVREVDLVQHRMT